MIGAEIATRNTIRHRLKFKFLTFFSPLDLKHLLNIQISNENLKS